MPFFIALSIVLVIFGIARIYEIRRQYQLRSDHNYRKFAEEYAAAMARRAVR